LNGDGKTDFWCETGYATGLWDVRLSTGKSWTTVDYWSGSGPGVPVGNQCLTGDLDGDGKTDFWCETGPATGIWDVRLRASAGDDVIQTVLNTSGGFSSVVYTPAMRAGNAVLPGSTLYPVVANSSGRLLVTQMTTGDGRGANYISRYDYYNGKVIAGTADQRKDLGFEWVKTTRPDGSYGYTYFNQSPDITGTPAREQQFDPNGQLTSDIINTVTTINPYPGTKITLVPQKRMIAYEGGVVVFDSTTDTQYDGYGFATVRTTTTAGFAPHVESLVYQHDVANNVYGRITEKVLYSGSLGGTKLNHERTVYNGSGATCAQPNQITLICEKQVWLDKDKNGPQNRFISTFYTHNIYGNLASTTDTLGHTTTYQFETDYQTFPTLVTNPKGYRTAYTFDPRYGHKLSVTDIENNVTASSEYDVFGRKVREKNVNGEVTQETIFANSGDPNNQYSETRTMDQSSDGQCHRM
jgi:hypothetical protein